MIGKKTRILSALLLAGLLLPSTGRAQQFSGGGLVHLNFASLTGVDKDDEPRTRPGLRGALFVDMSITSIFGVQLEAAYTANGMRQPDDFGPWGRSTIGLDYIEVPVLARVRVAKNETVEVHALFGVAWGLNRRANRRLESGPSASLKDEVKETDYRWLAVGTVERMIQGRPVVFDARYTRGFRSTFKDEYVNQRHQILSFGIGFRLF